MLDTTSIFYREYPEWLAIQVFLLLASAAIGVAAALHFSLVPGIVVGVVFEVIFGAIGLYLPERRERVEQSRRVGG